MRLGDPYVVSLLKLAELLADRPFPTLAEIHRLENVDVEAGAAGLRAELSLGAGVVDRAAGGGA